ncbi:hypothetical protein Pla175_06660 [Pirellulimonas nuda]|uniref:DUF3805 domain-containing protein n=1 Tax=Pirellulimonas nuda TaxID=2528009 RepID=A0A518D749_9BACT|nr:hypothetical protein [Pirellulimonas nuda]QDU87307.1 hypothetical protein Pla175_06660 [Pirellulimonas nuda]
MSATYDKHGLHFLYPSDWTLDESNDDDDATAQVTVLGRDTAFWTVSLYSGLLDTQQTAADLLSAMREEYPDLESEEVSEPIGAVLLVGNDMRFTYLDLTSTALTRVFHRGHDTCVVLYQAEDEEMEEVESVMRAMTLSLVGATPAT